jgi:hypothetical protein
MPANCHSTVKKPCLLQKQANSALPQPPSINTVLQTQDMPVITKSLSRPLAARAAETQLAPKLSKIAKPTTIYDDSLPKDSTSDEQPLESFPVHATEIPWSCLE